MYDHSVVKNKTVLGAATENFTINWLPVFGLEIAIFMREIFLISSPFFCDSETYANFKSMI